MRMYVIIDQTIDILTSTFYASSQNIIYDDDVSYHWLKHCNTNQYLLHERPKRYFL